MTDTPSPLEQAGLTGVHSTPLERVPIRARGLSHSLSAWRVAVTCEQGRGVILLVEPSPQEKYFRGEGLFLGWPQQRLARVYGALLPQADDNPNASSFDGQLG